MEEEKLLERIATRETMITDQGNGRTYCGNCSTMLDGPDNYNRCPNCDYKLISGELYVNRGGLDF